MFGSLVKHCGVWLQSLLDSVFPYEVELALIGLQGCAAAGGCSEGEEDVAMVMKVWMVNIACREWQRSVVMGR